MMCGSLGVTIALSAAVLFTPVTAGAQPNPQDSTVTQDTPKAATPEIGRAHV